MTSTTGTSSSGTRVDMPGATARASASAAAPTVVSEGSETGRAAMEGQVARTGPGAEAIHVKDIEQV
jgi:hypothetical protein